MYREEEKIYHHVIRKGEEMERIETNVERLKK